MTTTTAGLCTQDSVELQCERACMDLLKLVSMCRCVDGEVEFECFEIPTMTTEGLPEFSTTPPPTVATTLVVSSAAQTAASWIACAAAALAQRL